ncbi:hypothetical protein BKK54_01075 [Rodentibacter genomosp. 1]|uniref:Uncharacterized protein n=2 Tax=Rodentibacter genomosp. 1 TaxID=1908264 RepID=A0A1V3J9H7_9PAST|nr:hypothetical protein BKK54_01075 [Rodentibacter genomosp. 1]
MERSIDWILFIGIFIVFPTLVYQTYSALPHISWFSICFVSFIGAGLISAIFVTPFVAIVGAVLGLFSRN